MSKPRSTLIYGDSGSTKTSQLYFIAKYYLKKWKKEGKDKKFRLVSADGGGYAPFQDRLLDEDCKELGIAEGSSLESSGLVQTFDITNRMHSFADIHRIGTGFWPRWAKDKTGARVQMLKSTEQFATQDFSKIGGYLTEGTTSISSALLNHLRNQDPDVYFNKNSRVGQLKGSFVFTDDDYVTMGAQESHYGMVQTEMYQIIVQEFDTLPVDVLVWTGLTGRGEDKRTGASVYGPKLAGDKRTYEVPSWFMDTYHLSDQIIEGADGKKRESKVAWFKQHRDDLGTPYLCKPRVLPERFPLLLKEFPNGFVELDFEKGITRLLESIERI